MAQSGDQADRPDSAPPTFLSGGGDMGALMRALDWSATPLGRPQDWPQSLRTTVSTCLNSRFPILIWWGPQLCKIYNDAYRPMLGNKHPRSLGQPGRDCWPEIWDVIGPMLQGVLERGEATWSEDQLLPLERHGFAEECYFTYSYSPIYDETDRVGGVFCAVTETTGHVLAERRLQTLRLTGAALAQARTEGEACKRAALVLDDRREDTPFALIFLRERSGDGIALAACAGADDSIGEIDPDKCWHLSEAVARREPVVAETLDASARAALAKEARGARGAVTVPFGPLGMPSGFLVAGLSRRLVYDGEYRGFLESLAAQLGTAVAGARALDDAMEQAERLAEIDRAKTAFFSNVSHEFRTPLTLMLGPLEDALSRPPHVLAGENLRIAHRSTLRLLKLVNALLDFSRIEAGRMSAVVVPMKLAAFTRDVASAFRSTIEQAGLRFDVACEGDDEVEVDPDMWEKIVLNLISNAFKFTPSGGVRVAMRCEGEEAVLAVADTGSGIAGYNLPRLFQRFERIENPAARTSEGTGIGLALVRELVQMHAGRVDVESEPGRGTKFTVRIPRRQEGARTRSATALPLTAARAAAFVGEAEGWRAFEEGVSAAASAPWSDERDFDRVLVVDDNADMCDYLRRLLSPHWQVECAADGVAALEALDRGTFDLVVSDAMMPNLDGFGLLRAIRERRDCQSTRVVMLSARAGEEARIGGLAAGADDYLVKPFSGRELVARIRSQLQLKRARSEIAIEKVERVARQEIAREEARMHKVHLETLLTQAPTPMCILRGPSHIVEHANPAMCRACNASLDRVEGRPVFQALPQLEALGFHAQLDGVLANGVPFLGRETPVRDAEGALRYFDYVFAPLSTPQGGRHGILVIGFDVTHQVAERGDRARPKSPADSPQ